MQQPDTKVTVGLAASAILGTGLWIAKLIVGHEIPITANEAVYVTGVLVFVIQYATRNKTP